MIPKLNCKTLLFVSDKKNLLTKLKSLKQVTRQYSNPLGLSFEGISEAQTLKTALAEDGDVQAIIIEAHFGLNLVKFINQFRPELNIYILLQDNEEADVVRDLSDDWVDGYFYENEPDYRGWFNIINAQLQEKSQTPFYDSLKNYVHLATDSWHTPGHSSGNSLRVSPWIHDFYDFFGENYFYSDLSVSVEMLDSLMEPRSIIAKAQQMAAKAFGARWSFFVTNGTSTANKVILQTLLAPGDKILLDRNSHKSVHHAVILSGADPYYLDSTVNTQFGIFGPVLKSTIKQAIEANPDAKVLLLTSCTYDGFRYDLKPIIDMCHEKGLKVIIDEAWYGHAKFHPELRPTALECGADYVGHSTHKVMSAFSQASMIHVNDPDFNAHIFRENLNMHTSTSPQYSMLASLDVARKQMVMEGFKLLSTTLKYAKEITQLINAIPGFRVLKLDELLPKECADENIKLDPTKITIDISSSGYTTDELQSLLLKDHDIQVEKTTFNTLSLLITIGTTKGKISRLYNALTRLAKQSKQQKRLYRTSQLPKFSRLACLPRDAYYSEGTLMALIDENDKVNANIIGKICADQITPYPPGIPVLVPGQEINEDILKYLTGLLMSQKHIEIHGIVYDGYLPCLRILQ